MKTGITDRPPARVLEAFGMQAGAKVERLGGTRNANFRLSDGQEAIVLRRRHPAYCNPQWLEFDHAALAFLKKGGAPVLTPIACGGGATWLEEGGGIWEAYDWVSGDAFHSDKDSVLSLAEALARFHAAGRGFGRRYSKGGHFRSEPAPERLLGLLDRFELELGTRPILNLYREQVRTAARRLPDTRYATLRTSLVHGDVQPANTIFKGPHLCCLIDYDWLNTQSVIYDLAFALVCFCGTRAREFDGGDIWSLTAPFTLNAEAGRDLLATYVTHGGRLSPPERAALMEQTRLTWAHMRVSGALKVRKENRLRFLSRDAEAPFEWIEPRRRGDWF